MRSKSVLLAKGLAAFTALMGGGVCLPGVFSAVEKVWNVLFHCKRPPCLGTDGKTAWNERCDAEEIIAGQEVLPAILGYEEIPRHAHSAFLSMRSPVLILCEVLPSTGCF